MAKKITTSTELMYNYKQFELFDQQDKFTAVQTSNGHSMFFGQSTDGKLYLVLEESGSQTGWNKYDLSKELAGTVKTFSVAQNHSTSTIHIALAMSDPSGSDKLYLCMNLSNSSLDWVKNPLKWKYKTDDRVGPGNPKLIIDDIHLSDTSSGHENVVVDTANEKGFVDRYWINNSLLPAWNKHDLSFNIDANIADKSRMGRKVGEPVDGTYTFGAVNDTAQFVYTPLYSVFNPSSAPNPTHFDLSVTGIASNNGSFAICKALSGDSDATDLFVGGNKGLYYLASSDQKQMAKPEKLITHELMNSLRSLHTSVHDTKVVVWGLNEDDQVFHTSCEISQIKNTAAWSTPLPLMSGVSEISQYIDNIKGGLTLFGLSANGLLQKGKQDPTSSKWNFSQIELPVKDVKSTAKKAKSFTTSIKVTDEHNNPSPNTEVTLTPAGRVGVYINKAYYALNGDPIQAKTDASGTLSIVEWVNGIDGTTFDVAIGISKSSINPSAIPMAKIKNLGTVSDLENAKITNHDGSTKALIPSTLSGDDKKALAQSISDLNEAHSSIVSNPIPSANAGAAMAINVEAGSTLDYIEVLWGDLVESLEHFGEYVVKIIKDEASKVWHFVVTIGKKIYGFIINTVDKIVGALKSIWKAIVKGFEDLWEFIKFLFDWQDMLLTRDVFKQTVKIFMHRIGEDLQQVKVNMDNSIVNTETVIKAWANPATTHPPLGKHNSSINETLSDKESNPSVHSAPSELLKNHFVGNVHKSTVNESVSKVPADPTWSGLADLSEFVTSEKATLADLKEQIIQLFLSGDNKQQNPDLESILKKIIADVAIGALDLFKMAADKILDFLTLLIYEAIEILDAPFYIPVVSDILKDLFDIELPSILDVLCLVGAVPTTIVYKVVNGHAPYESGDDTIHEKITKAKTFAELQANFKQTGDKITLDKDAQAVIFETFYLLSGISTIINGVLVVLDEEVDGSASTVLSTPKTITSLLSSATIGIASIFHIPIGIKNSTMSTFSSVLSKIGMATSLGFAVAPKVIAKAKGITEEGPLEAMKTQINLVKSGVNATLAFIGLVPQVYHLVEIIADGDANTDNGALGILDSTQGITKRLSSVAGFAALVDPEEISKQIIIIVQGVLVGVTGGIQIEEAAVEAVFNKK